MDNLDSNDIACGLIKQFEGCRLTAYQDQAGVWTIGWGSTYYGNEGTMVEAGDNISQAYADTLLSDDVQILTSTLYDLTPNANDYQRGAMLSLIYDIGEKAFRTSSVLRFYLQGDKEAAANAFLLWDKVHIDGKLVDDPGLINRRRAERTVFLTPYLT